MRFTLLGCLKAHQVPLFFFIYLEKNVRVRQQFEVRLYGECLPHVSELRYLGVWFDAHLTWGRQIQEATSRAMARLWLLRRLGG